MKDLSSFFGSEVFRPTVTLLIPGFIASVAFLEMIQRYINDNVKVSLGLETHSLWFAYLLLFIAAGLIVEGFGSFIESKFYDVWIKKSYNIKHLEQWNQYLRLAFGVEPVGHRYLRTIVLRMKFELGLCVSILISAVSCLCLKVSAKEILWSDGGCFLVLLCVVAYLFLEGYSSAKLLSDVRAELLKGITVIKI